MKTIVNGKRYDTETATAISSTWWFDDSVSYHQKETLYRKKTGEFFIYDDKKTTWGDIHEYKKIRPICEQTARKWMEEYDNDNYESVFGEVEE